MTLDLFADETPPPFRQRDALIKTVKGIFFGIELLGEQKFP